MDPKKPKKKKKKKVPNHLLGGLTVGNLPMKTKPYSQKDGGKVEILKAHIERCFDPLDEFLGKIQDSHSKEVAYIMANTAFIGVLFKHSWGKQDDEADKPS